MIEVKMHCTGAKTLVAVMLLLLVIFSAKAAPAHAIPTYRLEVQVECASPEAARSADLKFPPLPPGKNTAFSCRWDDSNPRHAKMKKLMTEYGYKGTFYLCQFHSKAKFNKEVMPELCKDGCTIGNHTMNHRPMPYLSANGIHYEMLQLRILYEDASNQTMNAFVFPYGKYTDRFDPQIRHIIASALRRCGMLGGADKPMTELNRLPGNEFYSTEGCDVRPGDKNTDPARFDKQVRKFLPKPGNAVHMALGVHTWHSEEDFSKLEGSLKKYARRPDWWYCSENEYNAYAYMTRHVKVVKKEVRDRIAVFTLDIPCPEFLGSDVPLWAKCGDKDIRIEHSRRLPALISLAGKDGSAAKFPGLSARVSYTAPDRIRLEIDNPGTALTDVRILLRLPTDFLEETAYFHADMIEGEFSREWTVTPNPAWKSGGRQLTAAQIDFTRGNVVGRVWASHLREIRPDNPLGVSVRCSGRTLDEETIAKLALPGTNADGVQLVPLLQDIDFRVGIFPIPDSQRSKEGMTVLQDFDGGRRMTLRSELPPGSRIRLNGKPLAPVKDVFSFDAPAGRCRLLLQLGRSNSPVKHVVLLLTPADR